ncbi:MAG: CPBP family intramembrane glutamic endopeptidase [Myxococcota bacterium]
MQYHPVHATTSEELRVVVIVGVATVLYLAYHLLSSRAATARFFPAEAADDDRLRTRAAFWRRWVGAALFGLVPALPAALFIPGGLDACGLNLHDPFRGLYLSLAFTALTLPLSYLQSRKPSFREHYPEVRAPLTGRTAAWNVASWAAYLVAYELFFRGYLVLGLAPVVGPLPAVAISLMGYVWVHLGKHPGEAVGTLVSGTWFGLVALHTGSVLGPIVAHLAIAVCSDHFAAMHGPRRAPEVAR